MTKQDLKLIASPWIAPAWMKRKGHLKTECYQVLGKVLHEVSGSIQGRGCKLLGSDSTK